MSFKLLIGGLFHLNVGDGYNLVIQGDNTSSIYRWTGAAWVSVPVVQYWDGASMQAAGVKYYDGNSWIAVN